MAYLIRSVLLQLSGLAGILAFLAQMWTHAPLDQSIVTGAVVGGGVYMILLIVDIGMQQVVAAHLQSTREKTRIQQESQANEDATSKDEGSDQKPSSKSQPDRPNQKAASDDASSPSTDQEMVTA
jgi:hypothetical protein